MHLSCPRCREPIESEWDHCHRCGLTVRQLERMAHSTKNELHSRVQRTTRQDLPDATPGYFSPPVYGRGPIARSTGYAPAPPGLADVRRDDTVIELFDGEARITVTGTGASARAPAPPSAPVQKRSTTPTLQIVELVVTVLIAVAAIAAAIAMVR